MPVLGTFAAASRGGFGGRGGLGAPYDVEMLFVAGGGGAGIGGGGGGGLRTSTISLFKGGVYTVTVGAGGSGATGASPATTPDVDPTQGGPSEISGPKVTTFSAAGGGAGGGSAHPQLFGRGALRGYGAAGARRRWRRTSVKT